MQMVYYSNVIHLADNAESSIRLLSTMVKDQLVFTSSEVGRYELVDAMGKIICSGRVLKGANYVNMEQAPAGVLFIRISAGTRHLVRRLIKQ